MCQSENDHIHFNVLLKKVPVCKSLKERGPRYIQRARHE
uniref:Uncharacterized protein n=1 Tax=Anguilla anguilla TaxID=7936 RepID=A0A0E9P9U2_ANGAN